MFRILIFTTLLHGFISDPRTPRIYNVLISSNKNLAPSQALPVYEPVLRTTSVGLAFPPLYYSSLNLGQGHIGYEQSSPSFNREANTLETQNQPNIPLENDNHGYVSQNQAPNRKGSANHIIPLQPSLPFPYYTTNFNYSSFLPRPDDKSKAEPVNSSGHDLPGRFDKIYGNSNSEQTVANFKRNPEIPDVPPPPLPVRTNFNT